MCAALIERMKHLFSLQLKYIIAKNRKEINGGGPMTIANWQKFFGEFGAVPVGDLDKPFILNHSVKVTPGKPNPDRFEPDKVWFASLFTTRRLLRHAVNARVIHADSTYKILYQGYPIQVFGTTDKQRKFHLIAVGVSSNENEDTFGFMFEAIRSGLNNICHEQAKFEVLVADAAMAIQNGFKKVFPDGKVMTCWYHVKKNVRDKSKKLENGEEMLADLNRVQLCPDENVFGVASNLFIEKWSKIDQNFTSYFNKQWLNENHKNWFHGAELLTPVTNNGLEATNNRFKSDFFLREKCSLAVFKEKLTNLLSTYSCEYRDGLKEIKNDLSRGKRLWKDASGWANSEKKPRIEDGNDVKHYYVPAGAKNEVEEGDLEMYQTQNWKNFDDFSENQFGIWKVIMPEGSMQSANCTCPIFLKEYCCKHILGMAVRLQLDGLPDDLKVMEKKRKVGRLRKAGPALSKD